jgi:hypothetical protein
MDMNDERDINAEQVFHQFEQFAADWLATYAHLQEAEPLTLKILELQRIAHAGLGKDTRDLPDVG